MPSKFGITTEIVQDSDLTEWEKTLSRMGLQRLALIQREVRLRCMPTSPLAFHRAVVGPYLTVLSMFALHLVQRFGSATDFVFLSRSSDDLLRVFVGMFPGLSARAVDVSRRLARDPQMRATLAGLVRPGSLAVDIVGTGRSFLGFAEDSGCAGQGLYLLLFLEGLLAGDDRATATKRETNGKLRYFDKVNDSRFRLFEHLAQAHYPLVDMVSYDARSGGVVRSFGASELDPGECELIGWKSSVITTFVRTLRRRGLDLEAITKADEAVSTGLQVIFQSPEIAAPFTSFDARERWG